MVGRVCLTGNKSGPDLDPLTKPTNNHGEQEVRKIEGMLLQGLIGTLELNDLNLTESVVGK